MIRVALHAVAGSRGGPRTYAVELAHALARRGGIDLVVLTDRPDDFAGIETVALPRFRPYADHFVVARLLKKLAPHIYHNTKNAIPRGIKARSIVTVHDLAAWHFPETFTLAARLYVKAHTASAVRRADLVITPSEHAARDLVTTLKVPKWRIRVIPHGVSDRLRSPAPPPRIAIEKPYLLSVGTIQARKNLDVLVRAVKRIRTRDGVTVTLVVAGRRGWRTEEFDAACLETPVKLLGAVQDEDLPALYANASAFVQPSSYEGFGLTALEAMASGAPVVAADAGSLPEVVGDAGLLVPPRDEEALADALLHLLTHPARAREFAERGRLRAAGYSWDASAATHAALYEELAS